MKVHFNLFGGTVLKLGTKTHHDAMLAGIDRLDPTGCFALTELGFGERAGSSGFMHLCSHPLVLVSSRVLMNIAAVLLWQATTQWRCRRQQHWTWSVMSLSSTRPRRLRRSESNLQLKQIH